MICTLKIKLQTDMTQHNSLLATMKRFNDACNHISRIAHERKVFSKFKLQKACYYEVRELFEMPAQLTIRAISKVSDSYKTDKKTVHIFKATGAVVYDERILSYKKQGTASLLTLEGRIVVPMIYGKYHQQILSGKNIRGQADLILQNGIFYLMLAVDLPENLPVEPTDFIGVDIGIVNLATDSLGDNFSGKAIDKARNRYAKLRARLQAKGTKSAKRLLKKISGKEMRFSRDTNHVISKKIVEKAKALRAGIAIEDLKGIRKRMEQTVSKQQRNRQSSWAFYQLRLFIGYKAALLGLPIVLVDPRDTSRTCPFCGCVDKKNRKNRNDFACLSCKYAASADYVAAMNIRNRAVCQSAIRGVASL